MVLKTAIETKTKNDSVSSALGHVRIVCPECRTGELSLRSEREACCAHCGAPFLVRDRIIDLLPGTSQVPMAAPMEWGWMVEIYETRWWRSGPINTLFFGISFDDEYNMIKKAMDLEGDETVLDLACGPGMYARPLAKTLENGTVVGLDLSAPMLGYTAFKAQSEGIDNLLLIHGSAKDLPFPDNQFDVVNCCGALHLFSQVSTVQGICRVLKPGGRFTVGTTRRLLQGPVGRRIYDYLYRRGGVKYFYLDELESLLKDGGFTEVTCLYEKRYWHIMRAVKPE